MLALDGEQASVVVEVGLGGAVVACTHGKSVGNQVGEAEYQHDGSRQVRADDPGDDGKGRDRSINPAIDPIAEIVAARVLREPFSDRLRGVVVFQLVT